MARRRKKTKGLVTTKEIVVKGNRRQIKIYKRKSGSLVANISKD